MPATTLYMALRVARQAGLDEAAPRGGARRHDGRAARRRRPAGRRAPPRRGPAITLVGPPRARVRLRQPRRPGAVRRRDRAGAGDARNGDRGLPRPRAGRGRRGARDDRHGARARRARCSSDEDGVRPAIDLVYRSIVRAATEIPDARLRALERRRRRRSGAREPQRRPLAARCAAPARAGRGELGERRGDLVDLLAQQPARDQLRPGAERRSAPASSSSSGRSRLASTTSAARGPGRRPAGQRLAAQVEARAPRSRRR